MKRYEPIGNLMTKKTTKVRGVLCWASLCVIFSILVSACHPAIGPQNTPGTVEKITIAFADFSSFQGQYQPLIDAFEF